MGGGNRGKWGSMRGGKCRGGNGGNWGASPCPWGWQWHPSPPRGGLVLPVGVTIPRVGGDRPHQRCPQGPRRGRGWPWVVAVGSGHRWWPSVAWQRPGRGSVLHSGCGYGQSVHHRTWSRELGSTRIDGDGDRDGDRDTPPPPPRPDPAAATARDPLTSMGVLDTGSFPVSSVPPWRFLGDGGVVRCHRVSPLAWAGGGPVPGNGVAAG